MTRMEEKLATRVLVRVFSGQFDRRRPGKSAFAGFLQCFDVDLLHSNHCNALRVRIFLDPRRATCRSKQSGRFATTIQICP